MILQRLALTTAACAVLAVGAVSAQRAEKPSKDQEAKRPKLTLRAQPQVGVAPARISLTAELAGGTDDFEEYYCPTIEWEWGDGTTSESKVDCEPYEAGKSQIRRRYSIQHLFRNPGAFRVYIHLKQKDRVLGSATTTVQVQPGLGGPF